MTASVTPSDGSLADRTVRIGTCAWSFDDWRTLFYPDHLPASERLAFYARWFDTVEIDSTFYSPPSPHVAGHWLDATPDSFLFAAKLPREITHDRKLRQCDELLAQFLASVSPLRRKLACLLVQLPPYFTLKHDELALREFVAALPSDFRFAIEFRDRSWHLPRIVHLFEEHRICWVWNDITPLENAGEAVFDFRPRTTDLIYVRLLGDLEVKYGADGSRLHKYGRLLWPRDAALESWAIKVKQHAEEVSRVLIYGNNHYEGFSPLTCQRLGRYFGQEIMLPSDPAVGGTGDPATGQLNLL
jgi:uncharacterized protein YecE (DUF72 family)